MKRTSGLRLRNQKTPLRTHPRQATPIRQSAAGASQPTVPVATLPNMKRMPLIALNPRGPHNHGAVVPRPRQRVRSQQKRMARARLQTIANLKVIRLLRACSMESESPNRLQFNVCSHFWWFCAGLRPLTGNRRTLLLKTLQIRRLTGVFLGTIRCAPLTS